MATRVPSLVPHFAFVVCILAVAGGSVASCAKRQETAPTSEESMPASRDPTPKPIASVDEGVRLVDSFKGKPENFQLAVPDSLLDSSGMSMAIITDRVLARGWWPNGFVQERGYRVYRYTGTPPPGSASGQ